MYYLAIINNLQTKGELLDAVTIAKLLFSHSKWLFSPNTPMVRRLQKGDQLVVYAAGRNNRCFLGYFTLASEARILEHVPDALEPLVNLYFLSCQIENATLWTKPKPIIEFLPNLSFVKDKKNYGLYLRQGLREIAKSDYEVIIG